jgi:hypothetical protein
MEKEDRRMMERRQSEDCRCLLAWHGNDDDTTTVEKMD